LTDGLDRIFDFLDFSSSLTDLEPWNANIQSKINVIRKEPGIVNDSRNYSIYCLHGLLSTPPMPKLLRRGGK
jgi:hypothetical protein